MIYNNHDKAIILNDLANSYAIRMRYTKAIERYREALALYIGLAKKSPTDYSIHIAHVFSNLSIIYLTLKKAKEADEFHQNSLRVHRALVKHNPNRYSVGLASCIIDGVTYLKQHSLTLYEAEAVIKKVSENRRTKKLLEIIDKLRNR